MRIKKGTLILTADGAKMVLYRNDGGVDDLDLTVLHQSTDENLASREAGTDTPGRTQASANERRSSYGETDWHQQAEDRFAREVAGILENKLVEESGANVVVAAAPRTLGELRKHYGRKTTEKLAAEIGKDLTNCVKEDVASVVAAHAEG